MAVQDLLHQVGCGVTGFEGEGEDLTACCLYFFATGDEVTPVGTFDEEVREDFGDEFAGSVFVEEGDGIDGFEIHGDLGAGVFMKDGA